ncbi:helix-turn-helix transcriptional regulator [Kribbella pittospori]|uniref:Helix-turn-helix transcriptional regulator n=2 Tax=Kribbella pittospori TaxID=722689 RepID=A0A4R0K5F3_9ACTN|nr:helix-turn-helix transcriptional regulator [Kribbella pittospori]
MWARCWGYAAAMLVGRAVERASVERVLAEAGEGRCGSLVVRGEAGIGKTALLDHAAAAADGMRVLRVVGIESEAELPFAGLQLMLARFADRFDALPGRQGQALRTAFGASTLPGGPPAVGAAVLTLLSDLAEERPLLCLVDDAHWFDRSSIDALLFAVRRLHTDPVAMIFAARDGDRPFPAAGLESIALKRLDQPDSTRLLASVRTLPREAAERVLAESEGNPLAILELAASDRADRPSAPVAPLPASGRLEEHFRLQVRALPENAQRALLLAAADHTSELQAFLAAAASLGLAAADLEQAEQERLVRVTSDSVEFRHPLIRSAVYQDAPFAQRVAAHEALAESFSDPRDADRRAWHLAAAAGGTDDLAAAELERAALRAVGRGGPASAARALERAAQLSNDRADRARRLVGAARATYDAGGLDHAAELAAAGGALTRQPSERAEANWIRAQVAYERISPAEASALSLAAAVPIVSTDPHRAVSILAEATWCARDAADPVLLGRCAEQLQSVPGGLAEALIGFSDLLLGNVKPAVASMRTLLPAALELDATLDRLTAGYMAVLIGEDTLALKLLESHVATLRLDGALGWLPYAQEPLALAQLVTGRFQDAEATVTEAIELATDLGHDLQVVVLTSISAWLAAVRGDASAGEQADLVLGDTRQHRMSAALVTWGLALVDLMAGQPAAALDRLERVCDGPSGRDVAVRAIPDHVEAAVRAGETDRARRYLPALIEWATESGNPAAQALVLRCEALLSEGGQAQQAFEAALRLEECGPYDRARTCLAYGEWLRRNRRRTAARAQLMEALSTFERIAAYGWERRVRTELTALGDTAPEPATGIGGAGQLTPQELQVVRRAAQGMSNREIAAELFLSPRTVGHHLYKAYPKLGVSRRSQLAGLTP